MAVNNGEIRRWPDDSTGSEGSIRLTEPAQVQTVTFTENDCDSALLARRGGQNVPVRVTYEIGPALQGVASRVRLRAAVAAAATPSAATPKSRRKTAVAAAANDERDDDATPEGRQ